MTVQLVYETHSITEDNERGIATGWRPGRLSARGREPTAELGQRGRAAGELLGRTGLSDHRCALDALLAVVALDQPRPVVLLTSDPRDLARLTEEPGLPRTQRVGVVRV